jgi:hypothetical protein
VLLPRSTFVVFCALCLAPGARQLSGADESSTAFTAGAPVVNFRVTTFTREGHRSWLLCGAEGHVLDQNQLAVTNLNLSVFSGDASNRVESIFLSPTATALINEGRVRGRGHLRLITDDLEATGEDWLYDHREKKVSIHKNVRVVFHARLQSLLQ